MNCITKYLARFIERLSVPHCEDCKHITTFDRCSRTARFGRNSRVQWPTYVARTDKDLCGKRGRYFERKEKTSEKI